jgi:hypothetical protein
MHGRWRFRIAKADATGEYISSDGKPLEHTGTDAEALAIAVRLQDEHPQVLHVEAVSVGAPVEITDAPGRLQLRVQGGPVAARARSGLSTALARKRMQC